AQVEETNLEREETIRALQTDLRELEFRADEAVRKETEIQGELEAVRQSENSKAEALQKAQEELSGLRAALEERELVMLRAAEAGADREEKLQLLQQEMESLRS